MANRYTHCTYFIKPKGTAALIQAVGLFHFKPDRLNINHVSMHEEALTLNLAENLLAEELGQAKAKIKK